MYETGKITNVWWDDLGSELVVDAASGTATLFVDDAYDFNRLGGTLRITSDTATADLAYISVDVELDSITLAANLAATWAAGAQVLVVPTGQQLKAMVDLDDSDEGIVAIIPSGMDTQIEDGIRDETDQEAVQISDDSGRWEVSNIDDERGIVQGTQVDMSGVDIPPYVPTAAPGTSPEIEVSGNATSLVVQSEPVEAGTRIKYYVSTTDGFTPGPTNLFAETQATVVVVNTLPDGTALAPDTPYYVVAQATNDVGDSLDYSTQVSDTLHMDVVSEAVLAELVAGFILAGKIQVGQAYISSTEGIVIPQPDGGVISFPVDGSFAQITAKLIARSLSVTNNLTVNGDNNQVFGQITLGEGIVKPQTPPTLSSVFKSYNALGGGLAGIFQGMLTDPADSNAWLFPFAFFGTGVRKMGKAQLDWYGDITISGIPAAIDDFQPFGGMIYAPSTSRYVMLGTATDSGGAVRWYLVTFSRTIVAGVSDTFNYQGRLDVAAYSSFPKQVRMAFDAATNDGYIFYMNGGDNKMKSIRFTPSSTPTRDGGVVAAPTALGNEYHIGGVSIGNADFGAKRFVVALKGSSQLVFSGSIGSLTRQTNEEHTRPGSVMDITWDGSRFWSLTDDGNIYKHSTNKAPAGRNTLPVQARHTWFDGNGTTHETDGGPIETHNLGNRMWLRVETDPAPDTNGNPLDTEKADQIRVYISSDGTTTPRLQTADGWAAVTPNPTAWKPKTRSILVNTTINDKNVQSSAIDTFSADDVGAAISGTNIPAGATIASIANNGKDIVLSVNATGTGSFISATVTPVIATRSGLFEAINNSNSAPPALNGFASVGRAPGAFKSTRTDGNGPLVNVKGDGSGRIGPWQFDNLGKSLMDFGPERPGTIIFWPSTSIPLDCAVCDGQAVKRPTMAGGNGAAGNAAANNAAGDVAPYIRLWQLFGTTFGAGDGSTTFNLPDARRRMLVGASTVAATLAVGANDGVAIASRTLGHNHTTPNHTHTDTIALSKVSEAKPTGTGGGQVLMQTTSLTGGVTSSGGSSTGTETQPYLGVNVLIKL